ncbi:MAG: hypothetical protein J6X53_07830 [Abditibacteriota bacterium]|nr:hypothetical protein [Abditibacteriota bacterium]
MTEKAYNVGIYCRLSNDDERDGESVSIENQKLLLTQYVEDRGWNLVGNTFPAYYRMADSDLGMPYMVWGTDDKEYKNAERKTWEFIRDHVVTKTRPAEWYNEVSQDGVPDLTKPLVGEWKCPYHNVRMCIEILRRNMRAQEEL